MLARVEEAGLLCHCISVQCIFLSWAGETNIESLLHIPWETNRESVFRFQRETQLNKYPVFLCESVIWFVGVQPKPWLYIVNINNAGMGIPMPAVDVTAEEFLFLRQQSVHILTGVNVSRAKSMFTLQLKVYVCKQNSCYCVWISGTNTTPFFALEQGVGWRRIQPWNVQKIAPKPIVLRQRQPVPLLPNP